MGSNINHKLHDFNSERPYVWAMKLTEDEFVALEKELCAKHINYSNKEDALLVLVYMAEWYKRRYTNKSKSAYQRTFGNQKPDLKTVWETLGINHDFLYQSKDGKNLYLHSTFILGGLAVHFEQQKNEKPFLRALCRVYNNEDDSFDRIVDNNHSIAFRESIVRWHSLRDFLEAIITSQGNKDKLPYAISDIDNKNTEIDSLIKLIRDINYQVNKSKFRFEWVFTAVPGDDLISRRLRIWLNPEETGKLHQLLRIERLIKWGFTEPEKMRYIRLGVRYLNKGQVIKNADFTHPDLYYRNTGDVNVGFICEKVDYATCKNVPIIAFNQVQLVAWDDNEKELIVQDDMIDFDVMQLYRLEPGEDDWSSRVSNQKETALVFSDNWLISQNSVDQLAEKKTFYHKKYGIGNSINWCYINASVTIECGNDSRTYFNRQGYDHIIAHQYKETIQYTEDGKVMWHYSEDEDSPETVQPIFLIFSKSDIVAYHTETKEDGDEESCDATDVELCEYKSPGGNYLEWTSSNVPDYGYVKLRVTIKQKQHLLEAFYLPEQIQRNIEDNTIHYHDCNELKVYDDSENIKSAKARKHILDPVVSLNIGTKNNYIQVQIYRPAKLKEVCFENKILMYDDNGEVLLPYILKDSLVVNIYDDCGYQSYSCKDFRNVYLELNDINNGFREGDRLTSKIDNRKFSDDSSPKGVRFFVRKSFSKNSRLRYFFWDCQQGTQPIRVKEITSFKLLNGQVLFQDQRTISRDIYCEYMEKEDKSNTPFAKNKGISSKKRISVLEVFTTASDYNQYFFHFDALRKLAHGIKDGNRNFFDEIYNPLLAKRQSNFTAKDHKDLLRFAEEFCLDELKEQLIIKLSNIK